MILVIEFLIMPAKTIKLKKLNSASPLKEQNRFWKKVEPYLFVSPFFILFLIFGLIPLIVSFLMSLFRWQGVNPGEMVGIGNYLALLRDPSFIRALINTALLWIAIVPTMIGLALVLAVIVNSKLIQWQNVYRGFIFLPVLTSLVVASLVFTILFDQRNGFVTSVLSNFAIEMPDFRTTRYLAIPAIAGITLWRWTGYVMVIQLAGLQTLPESVLDAAKLDGATGIKGLVYITIPVLRPVLVFTTVLITIGVFNLFDEPFVLYGTKGGPGGAGLVLGTLMYRNAFEYFKLGYASAIAYVVAALIFAASLVQLRFASTAEYT